MKLSKEQQEKLLSKINDLWKNRSCEICNNNSWIVDDILFELREFHGGKTVLGSGAIKPLVTMACNSCGNTKLINAIQLGLVDPKNPSEEIKRSEKHEGTNE